MSRVSLVVRPDRVRALTGVEFIRGLLLALFLGSGFELQTVGLTTTAAGVSGFLTGISVVFTPLLVAAAFGATVGRAGWLAAGLGAVGLILLTSGEGTGLSL